MTQKRILFVANVAKEHVLKFHVPTIKSFKQHGWIVDVACQGDEDISCCDHQYKMEWKRNPFTFGTITGINHLKKIINKNNYDIVYCHTPVGGLVARLASRDARKKGSKVIYCAHGFHFFKGASIINWLIYYPIEKWLANYTDAIFVVNKEDYDTVNNKFNTLIQLVPEVGVDFERLNFHNKEKEREKYREEIGVSDETTALIYVAELIPNKNQIMLVNVTKKLIDEGRDVCLILVGPEHDHGKVKKYVDELGCNHHVKLLGWRNDVGQLMYSADICVASSIREGFGINLVEAMYCGLPVIATNNRGHSMIIENDRNGFLVDINDVDSMVQRINILIDNPNLFRNQDVDRFDCNIIAEELYIELNKLIENIVA